MGFSDEDFHQWGEDSQQWGEEPLKGRKEDDWPFIRMPWHPEAEKLVQWISDPGALEEKTLPSLRMEFAEVEYREIPPCKITLRYKYSAMFRSAEGELARVDVDVNGTYAVSILVEDITCPTRKEVEDLRQAMKHFSWYLDMCHQSQRVTTFLRETIGRDPRPRDEVQEMDSTTFRELSEGEGGGQREKIDWSSFRSTFHPRGLELLQVLADPESLEGLSVEELRTKFEGEYGYERITEERNGGVIVGWGEALGAGDLRTGAALVTNDQAAVLLGVGHDGRYFIEILAGDAGRPSRFEEHRVAEYHKDYAFQWYEQTEAFRNFRKLVQGRADIRKEHPVGEWLLEVQDRITMLLLRVWKRG